MGAESSRESSPPRTRKAPYSSRQQRQAVERLESNYQCFEQVANRYANQGVSGRRPITPTQRAPFQYANQQGGSGTPSAPAQSAPFPYANQQGTSGTPSAPAQSAPFPYANQQGTSGTPSAPAQSAPFPYANQGVGGNVVLSDSNAKQALNKGACGGPGSQKNPQNKGAPQRTAAEDCKTGNLNAKSSDGNWQRSVSGDEVAGQRDASTDVSSKDPQRGRNRSNNRWQNNKAKSNAGRNSNDPPKYEDIVKEGGNDNKNQDKAKMILLPGSKGPATHNSRETGKDSNANFRKRGEAKKDILGDRGPKNVDALNDLIKKEFGGVGAPTHNLPHINMDEKLFSGRNCLYVGNLPPGMTREDVNALMAPYGETVIDFYNSEKRYGFIRLKHREQTENAQRNLDGYIFRGRTLRVRLASNTGRIKVLNLDKWVTNELLKKAFSAFGEVERAEIETDNGQPTGAGFVEFSEKKGAALAMQACVENCFVLTASPRPVVLEEMDQDNNTTGYSERQLSTKNAEYKKAREVGPRFLAESSTEYNCATLWKSHFERKKQEEEDLAKKFKAEEQQLESRIETLLNCFRELK